MSDQPFEVGDTVRVKGAPLDTPRMTVTRKGNRNSVPTAWVTWYVEEEWKEHHFPTEALKKIPN